MRTHSNEPIKMKVFPKGQVVIPVSLRKKYKIDIGDQIEVVSRPEGILLKPVAKGSNKMSLTDGLFGVFVEYALERQSLSEEEVHRATEEGFNEGWTPILINLK